MGFTDTKSVMGYSLKEALLFAIYQSYGSFIHVGSLTAAQHDNGFFKDLYA